MSVKRFTYGLAAFVALVALSIAVRAELFMLQTPDAVAHHTTTWDQDKLDLAYYVDSKCGGGWWACDGSPLSNLGSLHMWNCTEHSRCAPKDDIHQYRERHIVTGYWRLCHVGRNTKIYHGTLYTDGYDYCGPTSAYRPSLP